MGDVTCGTWVLTYLFLEDLANWYLRKFAVSVTVYFLRYLLRNYRIPTHDFVESERSYDCGSPIHIFLTKTSQGVYIIVLTFSKRLNQIAMPTIGQLASNTTILTGFDR